MRNFQGRHTRYDIRRGITCFGRNPKGEEAKKPESKREKISRNHRERRTQQSGGISDSECEKRKTKGEQKEEICRTYQKEAPRKAVPPFDHVCKPRMRSNQPANPGFLPPV
jgi:hypothetical protein